MAIVAHQRKNGTVAYYVVTRWMGRVCWEPAGTVKREAQQIDSLRKREKKLGTFTPKRRVSGSKLTIRGFIDEVVDLRARKVRNAKDEMSWCYRHVLNRKWLADAPMGDVRPKHIDRLVEELRTNTCDGRTIEDRKRLSDKSINNVLHALRSIFRTAVREELVDQQPVELEPRTLKLRSGKEREVYTPTEVRSILDCAELPMHERVFCALAFFTGMRLGEVAGRRVRDILDAPSLPALQVETQYEGRALKTDNTRMIPIHPWLLQLLNDWLGRGFELYARHAPEPDDFIVPNAGVRAQKRHHTKKSANGIVQRACALAGVRYRTAHSTRHTFISAARRALVNDRLLDLITHNPKGRVIDRYTHTDWEPLCSVIKAVEFDADQTLHFVAKPSVKNGVVSGLAALRKHAKGPA